MSLKVRVGSDGRIRAFEILSIQEDATNPFVASPLRRFLGKLELFARGFKFSDGEVIALLREGLTKAQRTSSIREIRGEFAAIDMALAGLSEGDLCLVLIDQVDTALSYLDHCIAEVGR